MGKMKEIVGGLVVLVIIAVAAFLWLSPQGGQIFAAKAPPVSTPTLDGGRFDLAAYRGKPVLVNFWATDCPGCVEEIPDLIKLHQEFGPQGFAVVGMTMKYDDPQRVRNMVAQMGMPYVIALDTEGKAAEGFGGVNLVPTSFLIDAQGRIVERKLGVISREAMAAKIRSLLAQG
ncbi:MAG: TlpA disulfide reductase family protein [Pseudomonadota bacterium]|uniref:TlpA disulfide reductase family protein n=1 Tax=Thermithiobacillus tepidarius TaxID=929 RepID=UPI0004094AF1|nr:TlpA disulfide reductase family protein [Thermithiobacillus tepidarius]